MQNTKKATTMGNSDKYKEFENRLAELRKNAVALDKAMEARRKRKVRERLYSDEGTAERGKSECALFNKPISEILENGTIYEKVCLAAYDYSRDHAGEARPLTDEQRQQIRDSLRTQDEVDEYIEYGTIYDKLRDYNNQFRYVFKMYQLDLSMLQTLITKWEGYEQEAFLYSVLYRSLKVTKGSTGMKYSLTDGTNLKELDATTPETLLQELNDHNKHMGDVRYVAVGDEIKADIDFEGGLYSKIQEQVGEAVTRFAMVKAYCLALLAYAVKRRVFGLIPTDMLELMENARYGLFAQTLAGSKEYLRSTINEKKKNGEPVTPEEEHKAVYPDYEDIKADKEIMEDCKETLFNWRK